jgi:cephalosporin hydroxylase
MVLIDDIGFEESNLRKDILADVNRSEFVGNSRSQEAFDFVNDFDCMFDVVFVDGDHTYEGVSADVITYSRFVTPGGYLILHDTVACVGVKRVFDGLKVSNNFTSVVEFVDYDHRYPMGIGVIKRHG